MERLNRVVPLQLISEENESNSDPETFVENDDAGSDEDTLSRPTLTSKISNMSNDSVSSQPKQNRSTASKSNVRFGVRRRRSSLEKVLKDSEKTDYENTTSTRTSSFRSILQCDQENCTMNQNGSEVKTYTNSSEITEESYSVLLRYFSRATSSDKVDITIDLEQLRELMKSGVPIDATDIYGQTVLHEAARSWSIEVAKVLVEEGAEVNVADKFGRTPLHVAASVDYNVMIKFLLEKGANVEAKTRGENQSPLHYAARNEAVSCVKTLLIFNAEIDARDFKQRTPLQVAAEHDSAETAEVLLNKGASAMVKDDTGLSVLVLFILKMPSVALRAMDQFHVIDRTHRKQYLYLKSIENLEISQGTILVPSPLQAVVETSCYELIMHPLFQRLIEIKWSYFGRRAAWLDIVPNVFLAILYTVLGVTFPDKIDEYYRPLSSKWWRILIEIIVLALLISEICKEIMELVSSKTGYTKWKEWRSKEIKRDLEYCHPRCPRESLFVERQIETAGKQRRATYFQDVWNFIDWVAYLMLIIVFILHYVDVVEADDEFNMTVIQIMSCTLIVLWIRMLKFARPFPAQGPFVVILDHIIVDTFRWSFIFLMVYIPYGAAFWMNFGGRTAKPAEGYSDVFELMFTMLRFPIVDSNEYSDIRERSPFMTRLLGATYLVIGALILMNMFIALMSNTFQRVYDNATATAAMQRARLIQGVEPNRLLNSDKQYRDFINSHCCPEQRDYLVIMTEQEDQNRKQEEKISRLHSIINLRLGGKKFGKLDKSEFEIALEDIESLKASIVKMNFSLTKLAERLEQVAEDIHHDVGSLGASQTQIITQLKVDQERDIHDLKGDLNAKTESLKDFQAKKIEEFTAFHAESVGELKIVQAMSQGELMLRQAQNTEELKVLQAEGVEEIKLQQALGFADLRFTQVQCSEELKPPPLQANNQQNKRSYHQELKPFQLQMLEDVKLAKEKKFQDLKLSQEHDFQEIDHFQATTFENFKLSIQQEFKGLVASKEVRFEKLTHGQSWAGQRLVDIQSMDNSEVLAVYPGGMKGISPMESIANINHTQSNAIESVKSSQAKKIEDLKHLQARNFERLRRSQAESLFQLQQPEDLTALSAKYEKLDKERERVQSEEKYIGGLTKLYTVQKGPSKGREQKQDRKMSKAWAHRLEPEQVHANRSEEERSENESLKSLSAKSVGRAPPGEHYSPEMRVQRIMHEGKTSHTKAQRGSQESLIALEELSVSSNSVSPKTTPEREVNKDKGDPLVEKNVSGPEHGLEVKPCETNDSLEMQTSATTDKQEHEEENIRTHGEVARESELGEDYRSQEDHAEERGATLPEAHSVKEEVESEINPTRQKSTTDFEPDSGGHNRKEKRLLSKAARKGLANEKQLDDQSKGQEGKTEIKQKATICSQEEECASQGNPSTEPQVDAEVVQTAKEEVVNVARSEQRIPEETASVHEDRHVRAVEPEDNTASSVNANSKPEVDHVSTNSPKEMANRKNSDPRKEAKDADNSKHDIHQRKHSRVNQSEDKKKLPSDANSVVKETETRNTSRPSDQDDGHQKDVHEAKSGAQGQEERPAGFKERSGSIENGGPSSGANRELERQKGPTRSSNDHITSLMKLYGGMKVDAKKNRTQKSKAVKTTKKGSL